jgi:hypothetical protein
MTTCSENQYGDFGRDTDHNLRRARVAGYVLLAGLILEVVSCIIWFHGTETLASIVCVASLAHNGTPNVTTLAPKRNERLRLLEIGLGTNNPDVVSTMGASGKPGASLRAFRDFLPNARVFGADIDGRILFEEERILTYYVDQTRSISFDELADKLGNEGFDLVIDDGLHSPNANIATMIFARKY